MFHVSNMPGSSPLSWWPRPVASTDRDQASFNKTWWNRLGFLIKSESGPPMSDGYGVTPLPARIHARYIRVPHWFVAGLFGIVPTTWLLVKIRARRPTKIGHCPACGYDLRASKDRCPECGTAIAEHPYLERAADSIPRG
jgi:hypothetical protein